MDYYLAVFIPICLLLFFIYRIYRKNNKAFTPAPTTINDKQKLSKNQNEESKSPLSSSSLTTDSTNANSESLKSKLGSNQNEAYQNAKIRVSFKQPMKKVVSNYDRILNQSPKYFDVCLWLTTHRTFKTAQIMNRWHLNAKEADAILFELKEHRLISELRNDGFYEVYDNNENVFRTHFEQLKLSSFEYLEYPEEEESIDLKTLDTLFVESARIIVAHQQGSTALLQRRLNLGYNRAGRLIEQMENLGIVGPFKGSKSREVLIGTTEELEQLFKYLNIK